MSATTLASASSSTDPTAGDLWRAAKGPVAVLLVVLLGGLVLALVAGDRRAAPLDPRSATPSGARAVATLLRDHGVDVRLVTTSAAMAATARRGDTLLVTQPDLLAGTQVESVRSIGADLVLVAPIQPDRYVVGVTAAAAEPGVRVPGCRLPAARRAGPADSGALVYATDSADLDSPALCYARDGSPSLVQGQVDSRPVTFLGSGSPLTNSRLDD
jgi:uncharacterized protein DUF4350